MLEENNSGMICATRAQVREPVTIVIPGDAKGKQRPRFSTQNGRAFTPSATRTREGIVASLAMDAMAGRPALTSSVEMELTATLPVPKSWPKKRQAAALAGQERPAKKPDLDNIAKLVWDALNGIVYADDSQVVSLIATKTYGPIAATVVTIIPLD